MASCGDFTYGLENIKIISFGEGARLHIGKFCSVAQGVKIFLGGNHRVDWVSTYPFGHIRHHGIEFSVRDVGVGHPSSNGDVMIGNDVWIGQGVQIMSGVHVESGSVIAAGSLLTKDTPPYSIWGGNPARLLRYRFSADTIDELVRIQWWNLPLDTISKMGKLLTSPPSREGLELMKQLATPSIRPQ